jgi:hypothetical protein
MRFLSESVMCSLDCREKSWQMSLGRQCDVMVFSTSFFPPCKQTSLKYPDNLKVRYPDNLKVRYLDNLKVRYPDNLISG